MTAYKKYFLIAIRETYPDTAAEIISLTNTNFVTVSKDTQFALTSGNPLDKRLGFCSYFLALIMALDAGGESFERIRAICLRIVTAYVQPKNSLHAFVKRLVPMLTPTWLGQRMIRSLNKRVGVNGHNDGFIANIVTDRRDTFGLGYGVDIIECGICKLFKKHRFEKYASILCEVDEITSAMSGLKLVRTGTIATGASKCDFRFKRIDH